MLMTMLAAFLHHLLAFTLIACLFSQWLLLRAPLDADRVRHLVRIDALYGLSAIAVLAIGFWRLLALEKGWPFYQQQPFFYIKLSTFLIIGLLSIRPTLSFPRWKKLLTAPDGLSQIHAAQSAVRRLVTMELLLVPVLLFAAAAMARGGFV